MPDQSNGSRSRFFEPPDEGWVHNPPGTVYNCAAFVERGDAGRWVATSAGVPSVTASGPTEAEALDGLAAELARYIREHRAAGTAGSPWAMRPDAAPEGAAIRFVLARLAP